MHYKVKSLLRRFQLFLLGVLLCGCHSTPPESPAAGSFSWRSYQHPSLGFSLQFPKPYSIETHSDSNLIFRFEGYPVIAINFASREAAKQRGLWARNPPTGTTELGGQPGRQYIYNHCDGPFCMRTISYVVPHRDQYLALAFRTDSPSLGPIETQILHSFAFVELP